MTLEGNAAALALVVAGISFGGWATLTTIQIRTLRRELRAFRREFDEFLTAAGIAVISGREATHGADRYPGRLLDGSPAGVFRPGSRI